MTRAPGPFRRARPGPVARLRADFLTGLVVVLPAGLTLMLVSWAVGLIDHRVEPLLPGWLPFGEVTGVGLAAFLVVTTLVGSFARGFAGRRLVAATNRLMARVPVARTVHTAARQLLEVLVARRETVFRQVCLVQYPKEGIWALGFVTGEAPAESRAGTGAEEMLLVYVPPVPKLIAGTTLHLLPSDAIMLDMPVDEALKLIMSGGLVGGAPPARPPAPRRSGA